MGWMNNSLLQHPEAPWSYCGRVHVKEEARCCVRQWRMWRTKARRGRWFGWRQRLSWRDGVAPPLLLATLQFFFCQHRRVEQVLYRMIFFITNNVLNVTPQPPIKPNDLILLVLNYPTT